MLLRSSMLAIRALILLPAVLLAQPAKQTYTYKVVGDCAIQADVYRAPGDTVRPAILWIHGGALIMGNREGLRSAQ